MISGLNLLLVVIFLREHPRSNCFQQGISTDVENLFGMSIY